MNYSLNYTKVRNLFFTVDRLTKFKWYFELESNKIVPSSWFKIDIITTKKKEHQGFSQGPK